MLNACLLLCLAKWTKTHGPVDERGKPYQPGAFRQMIKELFYLFHKKGIQHRHDVDFDDIGEFHGALIDTWNDIRKKDPSFGTGVNRARADPEFLRLFIESIEKGVLKPYENAVDCLRCTIFTTGYYPALRGKTEQADLLMENCHLGFYLPEDGEALSGLEWAGVAVPWSKTQQLNLKKVIIERNENVLLTWVEDPTHKVWCPVRHWKFYLSKCHPEAKKFYGRILRGAPGNTPKQVPKNDVTEYDRICKEVGKDVWFAASGVTANNLGHNPIGNHCTQLAKDIGIVHWQRVTGHAFRALSITRCLEQGLSATETAFKARHASVEAQRHYAQETNKRKANRMGAMNPSGMITKKPTPPVLPIHLQVKKNSECPIEIEEDKKPEAVSDSAKKRKIVELQRELQELQGGPSPISAGSSSLGSVPIVVQASLPGPPVQHQVQHQVQQQPGIMQPQYYNPSTYHHQGPPPQYAPVYPPPPPMYPPHGGPYYPPPPPPPPPPYNPYGGYYHRPW